LQDYTYAYTSVLTTVKAKESGSLGLQDNLIPCSINYPRFRAPYMPPKAYTATLLYIVF